MKYLVVLALCVAVASANLIGPISAIDEQAELKEIIAAINSPSTDPATAAALQQMLNDLLGLDNIAVGPAIVDNESAPISVGPAIIDNEHVPISVGPAIIDNEFAPISVGPAIVDNAPAPISVGPAIVDEQIAAPISSPLVQIIINVKPSSGIAGSPVAIEGLPVPGPAVVDEIKPTPVIVVDQPEPEVQPVVVVDQPLQPVVVVDQPEALVDPVVVVDQPEAPVEPVIVVEQPEVPAVPVVIESPVVALPGILN